MMNTRRCLSFPTILLVFALCVSGTAATAEEAGLDLPPGRWEISAGGNAETVGKAKSSTKIVCLATGDPVVELVKPLCRAENRVLKDGVLTWDFVCEMKEPAPSISGKGQMRSEPPGFRAEGEFTITVKDKDTGKEKTTVTKAYWVGKRLGDCEK